MQRARRNSPGWLRASLACWSARTCRDGSASSRPSRVSPTTAPLTRVDIVRRSSPDCMGKGRRRPPGNEEEWFVNVAVKPLLPERVDDFLAFFDHENGPAFADNPEWAKCYCQFYRTPKPIDWNARPGEINRVAMRERIA